MSLYLFVLCGFCASVFGAPTTVPVLFGSFPYFYHNSALQTAYEANLEALKRIEDYNKMVMDHAKLETLDEKIEAADDGSYTPDNSGDYAPDNSGDYVPDDSGAYHSEGESTPSDDIKMGKSYSFGYKLDDQSREESGDSMGLVMGRYSFTNSAGNHDLHFKAGPSIGFLPTSGSLSKPNGLVEMQ